MRVLVEGEKYPLSLLESIIDARFYKTYGLDGIVSHVGYFYSFSNNEIIYILPKVFIDTNKIVLFDFEKEKLANSGFYLHNHNKSSKLKELLILFYRSLLEYKKRQPLNSIVNKDESLVLDSNIGANEYTYLDIIMNILNFHREHQNTILFIEKKHLSQQHKNVSWDKTIKKTLPYIDMNQKPIYTQAVNKKKYVDSDEILLSMFYSVLHHLKSEYKFNITIDKIYTIYTGKSYENLTKKAPKLLKRIKHKYFSDILVRIFKLMELYFDTTNSGKSKKKTNEFIRVDNYHIIFEDMVDKLFSDNLPRELKELKTHKDGKEIDHIFEYDALLNTSESIFYIGDSKYYKIGSNIEQKSKYKQFTYAKNVIQFNIDILNDSKKKPINDTIRYRDSLTEGYNISPNFFIQGRISDDMNFMSDDLQLENKTPVHSFHFQDRLFDRDSLFIHYYNINFLFVLKSYSQFNSVNLKLFREKCKKTFKKSIVEYLDSIFEFHKKEFADLDEIQNFVDTNFRKYNGMMYRLKNEELQLILATIKGAKIDEFEKLEINSC